ncbi:hypothetical protein EF917_18190 [Streptomyces sp. WAC00469]|nr:hypothetical protein EF917_18190 [Streptomyces sp. WAC00469]
MPARRIAHAPHPAPIRRPSGSHPAPGGPPTGARRPASHRHGVRPRRARAAPVPRPRRPYAGGLPVDMSNWICGGSFGSKSVLAVGD